MHDLARPPLRMKLRSARRLLLFCFFFCAAVLLISCIALSRDKSEVRSELEANFANGALVPQVYVAPDSRRGRYLANDCFILGTLVAGKGPLFSDVVNSPVIESGTGGACQQLRDALADPDAHPTYSYSRYFWGAKALVEPALAYASLDTIKGSLRACVYLTLCLAAAVAAVRAVRGGTAPRGLYVTVLVAGSCLYRLSSTGSCRDARSCVVFATIAAGVIISKILPMKRFSSLWKRFFTHCSLSRRPFTWIMPRGR